MLRTCDALRDDTVNLDEVMRQLLYTDSNGGGSIATFHLTKLLSAALIVYPELLVASHSSPERQLLNKHVDSIGRRGHAPCHQPELC